MGATDPELRQIVREEVRKSWVGIALFALGGLSAVYVFLLSVVVPKFQQIYIDALPGAPLPIPTKFVVYNRFGIVVAVLVWLIAGATLKVREDRHAYLWVNLGIFALVTMIGLTVWALIMPMVCSSGGGMSDAGGR